jgi:hypothetical protein
MNSDPPPSRRSPPPGSPKPKSAEAEARLAAALRANLLKRKAQAKFRTAAPTRADKPGP